MPYDRKGKAVSERQMAAWRRNWKIYEMHRRTKMMLFLIPKDSQQQFLQHIDEILIKMGGKKMLSDYYRSL